MKKIVAIFELIRLKNCIITAVAVWLGGYLTRIDRTDNHLVFAMIAAALACAMGNSFNDFIDQDNDKINHPNRVLPSGRLEPYQAVLAFIISGIFSIRLAFFVNYELVFIVVLAIVLLIIYNIWLKRFPLWGNLVIAILGGLTLLAGASANAPYKMFMLPGVLVPGLFALLIHLIREFVKDLEDQEGDMKSGYRTLAILCSEKTMQLLISGLLILLIVLTFVPLRYEWYSNYYYYIVGFGVDLPLFAFMIYLWISRNKDKYGHGSSLIKISMIFGLLAFVFSKN